MMRIFLSTLILFVLVSCQRDGQDLNYPDLVVEIDPSLSADLAGKIRNEVAVTVDPGLELSLWAADTLVSDPIAISIDPQGRVFYTSASRQSNSEFDIRGHRNWMTASISFETVEDRRAFLRETFSADSEESIRFLKDMNGDSIRDWRDLAVEKEKVWFVSDASGNGFANRAQLYLEDFHEEVTDVANGIEFHNGEVYIGAGPDLWRTKDLDGDGIADETNSISHGYAIHIGFSGHGMSGVKVGPQGRIWWGIGDIGANVVDQDGKRWRYPNQGVVVRSEPDGSNFEVYAAGVRNTHEFVFDQYGNLITEDNDGDHRGERERLVYLINGSDSGWRTNWQFGKYTDPKNNSYKVWMDERLHVPSWEGQAAYILPPIQNYINGPTGMVYNPGTALSPEWYNHFFIAEFRGSPANSPIHAFQLEPDGASFKMTKTKEVVRGLLPTGIDFAPDGSLFFADWIDGWGTKKEGRIWKLDVTGGADQQIRKETKAIIQAEAKDYSEEELLNFLGHQDQRVRQKAQFELVEREQLESLVDVAKTSTNQLARIHALWGISQLARKDRTIGENLAPFLKDSDPEIIAQAARLIGDIRYAGATEELIELLKSDSPRIQLMATEALGRLAEKSAFLAIVDMLNANDDQDKWLRHSGMIALGRIGDAEGLISLSTNSSKAVRMAAVVALRRMQHPGVANFLNDTEEMIVVEAARAINDDWNIEEALAQLAFSLKDPRFQNEAYIRRAINANLELGAEDNWRLLLGYAQRQEAPAAMRAEALAALSTWAEPSVFDRVDGRYRGPIQREASPVITAANPVLQTMIQEPNPELKIAAMEAAAQLKIQEITPSLFAVFQESPNASIRATALQAMQALEYEDLEKALELALADREESVRSLALRLLPASQLSAEQSLPLFKSILEEGSIEEQQATFAALKNFKGEATTAVLSSLMPQLISGQIDPAVQLDLIECVAAIDDPGLNSQLSTYENNKTADDPLAQYQEALEGGNAQRGRNIFYNNEAAQCVRCHAIFEVGGNAGPVLLGVGERLDKEQLLESMVAPSAAYSPGFGVVILELKDGKAISGIIMEETDEILKVKIGKEDIQAITKADISTRENIPSSMPNMGEVLSKRQIRDLVAFLSGV